jgi:hypothetical protein
MATNFPVSNMHTPESYEKMMPAPGSMAMDAYYDTSIGGSKLKLVHPTTAIDKFNYKSSTGAIDVKLANFGRFQTGTSIQAPLFYPPTNVAACEPFTQPLEEFADLYDMNWNGFLMVEAGLCSYEVKARNI